MMLEREIDAWQESAIDQVVKKMKVSWDVVYKKKGNEKQFVLNEEFKDCPKSINAQLSKIAIPPAQPNPPLCRKPKLSWRKV